MGSASGRRLVTLFGYPCGRLPQPTHVGCLCVWLVVGLGVDRIVDALRMLTVLTPLGFTSGVLGVLLFVLAY